MLIVERWILARLRHRRFFSLAELNAAIAAPDYHIELHGHFYSVPSGLIRQTVEARITEATIEVFHNGKRIAAHVRSRVKNRHTTVREHMPSAHHRRRRCTGWYII